MSGYSTLHADKHRGHGPRDKEHGGQGDDDSSLGEILEKVQFFGGGGRRNEKWKMVLASIMTTKEHILYITLHVRAVSVDRVQTHFGSKSNLLRPRCPFLLCCLRKVSSNAGEESNEMLLFTKRILGVSSQGCKGAWGQEGRGQGNVLITSPIYLCENDIGSRVIMLHESTWNPEKKMVMQHDACFVFVQT